MVLWSRRIPLPPSKKTAEVDGATEMILATIMAMAQTAEKQRARRESAEGAGKAWTRSLNARRRAVERAIQEQNISTAIN